MEELTTNQKRGVVESFDRKSDMLVVNKLTYAMRLVPYMEKNSILRGDSVTIELNKNGAAIHVTNNSYRQGCYFPKKTGFERAIDMLPRRYKMKAEKTPKEYQEVIAELVPFFGQEVIDNLSSGAKSDLCNVMSNAVEQSIRLLGITATYDDTKKDIAELAEKVLETSAVITLIIDGNSNQYLKKALPQKAEKEKK